jgi:hypothetical protein
VAADSPRHLSPVLPVHHMQSAWRSGTLVRIIREAARHPHLHPPRGRCCAWRVGARVRRSGKRRTVMAASLTERLEKCYTGAVHDVMREMGLRDFVLPPSVVQYRVTADRRALRGAAANRNRTQRGSAGARIGALRWSTRRVYRSSLGAAGSATSPRASLTTATRRHASDGAGTSPIKPPRPGLCPPTWDSGGPRSGSESRVIILIMQRIKQRTPITRSHIIVGTRARSHRARIRKQW